MYDHSIEANQRLREASEKYCTTQKGNGSKGKQPKTMGEEAGYMRQGIC